MSPVHPALRTAAALSLGLLASCNTGNQFYDEDGDGSPDSEDCAPFDAAIRPGIDDPIGDGIDANCDGADGVDRDGDGWGEGAAADCDDLDGAVHPGATDTVGNGIDENCDTVDGTDEDGDGYASEASGGTDCNDSEASVHPGADDVDGDGVDADCDGEGGDDDDSAHGDDDSASGDDDDAGDDDAGDDDAGDDDAGDDDDGDGVEACDNGIDDDGDGDVDCDDSDSAAVPPCWTDPWSLDAPSPSSSGDYTCEASFSAAAYSGPSSFELLSPTLGTLDSTSISYTDLVAEVWNIYEPPADFNNALLEWEQSGTGVIWTYGSIIYSADCLPYSARVTDSATFPNGLRTTTNRHMYLSQGAGTTQGYPYVVTHTEATSLADNALSGVGGESEGAGMILGQLFDCSDNPLSAIEARIGTLSYQSPTATKAMATVSPASGYMSTVRYLQGSSPAYAVTDQQLWTDTNGWFALVDVPPDEPVTVTLWARAGGTDLEDNCLIEDSNSLPIYNAAANDYCLVVQDEVTVGQGEAAVTRYYLRNHPFYCPTLEG